MIMTITPFMKMQKVKGLLVIQNGKVFIPDTFIISVSRSPEIMLPPVYKELKLAIKWLVSRVDANLIIYLFNVCFDLIDLICLNCLREEEQ